MKFHFPVIVIRRHEHLNLAAFGDRTVVYIIIVLFPTR